MGVLVLGMCLISAAYSLPAVAQEVVQPRQKTIRYRGELADSHGGPVVDGYHQFSLALYDSSQGGRLLWGPASKNVHVQGGEYTLELEINSPLANGGVWLEVVVDGEVMAPRSLVKAAKADCTIDGALTVHEINLLSPTSSNDISNFGNDLSISNFSAGEIIFGTFPIPGSAQVRMTIKPDGEIQISKKMTVLGDLSLPNWEFRNDGVHYPTTDGVGRIGGVTNRVGEIWVATLHQGDSVFANDFRITERNAAPEALVFEDHTGREALALSEDGTVTVGTPQSEGRLQVNGYVQLDRTTGPPPPEHCEKASERGLMKIDSGTGLLWICVDSGWASSRLTTDTQ
jgi:hypothetical protein